MFFSTTPEPIGIPNTLETIVAISKMHPKSNQALFHLTFFNWDETELEREVQQFRRTCTQCSKMVDLRVISHHEIKTETQCPQCKGRKYVGTVVDGFDPPVMHTCLCCNGEGLYHRRTGPYFSWLVNHPGLAFLPYPNGMPIPLKYKTLTGDDAHNFHRLKIGLLRPIAKDASQRAAYILLKVGNAILDGKFYAIDSAVEEAQHAARMASLNLYGHTDQASLKLAEQASQLMSRCIELDRSIESTELIFPAVTSPIGWQPCPQGCTNGTISWYCKDGPEKGGSDAKCRACNGLGKIPPGHTPYANWSKEHCGLSSPSYPNAEPIPEPVENFEDAISKLELQIKRCHKSFVHVEDRVLATLFLIDRADAYLLNKNDALAIDCLKKMLELSFQNNDTSSCYELTVSAVLASLKLAQLQLKQGMIAFSYECVSNGLKLAAELSVNAYQIHAEIVSKLANLQTELAGGSAEFENPRGYPQRNDAGIDINEAIDMRFASAFHAIDASVMAIREVFINQLLFKPTVLANSMSIADNPNLSILISSPKYTEVWAWEGPEGKSSSNRQGRIDHLASKYDIDRQSVRFFSLDYAMSERGRMRDLRGPTPLPQYDDIVTQEAAWSVISDGGAVIWHEKGDPDEDWPKHTFLKFTKL
jgi:hypothetical protein